MKKLTLLLCFAVSFTKAYNQQVSGDTLVADFKYLIKALSETHPDPYTGFGGKVFFHKEVFNIENQLTKGATLQEFTTIASTFLSNLEDGHTYINKAPSNNANAVERLRLPLETMVVSDGLIVSKISADHKTFLGSKLLSINGILVKELCDKVGKQIPKENIYGKYDWLSDNISNYNGINYLLPDIGKEISIELETTNGNKACIKLTYTGNNSYNKTEMTAVPKWPKIRDEFIYYDFLDKNKQVAYFRLSSIMTREPFVFMKQNNWENMEYMLENVYTSSLKKEMPENMDEAIDSIPELNKIFRQMLEDMKKMNSRYLVVDLRGNAGGFTPAILPTLYMLYGDKYFVKDMETHYYRLISPLYMKKINMTLDDFNNKYKTSYQLGDYTFPLITGKKQKSIEQRRKKLIDNAMGGSGKYIEDLHGKPVYSPEKVFVITDQRTFSAAFHYAFYLWKMDATVIGIPSGQAPNTYMEGTSFELPLTKLTGSISNSFQAYLPADDKRARIFYPDIMLTWDDYRQFSFDKYTDILYLLNSLNISSDK